MRKLLFLFILIFCVGLINIDVGSFDKEFKEYQNNKQLLIQEIDNYVLKHSNQTKLDYELLINLSDQYNIDIKFILAQSHIESHFGTKGIATKTNSMFNVGSFDGKGIQHISKSYKYKSINESIEPYLDLLTRDYLDNDKSIHDLMDNYVNKFNKRYASDEKYELKLKTTFDKISKNTKIDSLYSVYIESKNKIGLILKTKNNDTRFYS